MPHIQVNDVELYYEESGAGDPLVLVHGGWGDHHVWDAVAPTLAESFQVVTYDRRGHSRSERPSGQGSRREDEDDLAALVEALDCAPAHLVGNSWGGSTVIGLAARRPDLFRSVSAHEPPLMSLVGGDPEVGPLIQDVQTTIRRVLDQLRDGDIEGGSRRFVEEVALGPGAWDLLPVELRETSMNNAPTFVDDMGDPHWSDVDLPGLARLSLPTLLTQGDQSPRFFLEIIAELARVIGEAEVHTFAGAGHAPHLTNPEDYVAVIGEFAARTREPVATAHREHAAVRM
jgi:pimeloyl-ACP methyl ester carboxylesterase